MERFESGPPPEPTPERQEQSERTSLEEIFSSMRERLQTFFAHVQEDDLDREIETFERQLRESSDLGRMAGEYFRFLIPHALKKPDHPYETSPREVDYFSEKAADVLHEADQKALEEPPREFFDNLQSNVYFADEQRGEVHEAPEEDSAGGRLQEVVNVFRQEGGPNAIREHVQNVLYPKANRPQSDLAVINTETKKGIDLSDLLPNDFRFAPEDLRRSGPFPVDLRAYGGTGGSRGEFYADVKERLIAYGDLTERGGMVSLLHEISHAWQQIYYDRERQGSPLQNYFYDVTDALFDLWCIQKWEKDGELKPEEATQQRGSVLTTLRELGVEVDLERWIDTNAILQEREVRLTDNVLKNTYIVRSDRIDELVTDFERTERDAWAHGLKALRFLRRNGIDLEPELKTLQDVKAFIHPCLGSHQEHLSRMIESLGRGVQFGHSL